MKTLGFQVGVTIHGASNLDCFRSGTDPRRFDCRDRPVVTFEGFERQEGIGKRNELY